MGSRKDNALTVFRLHVASALLLFEEKNPGLLNVSSEEIRGMILGEALSLVLIHPEERFLVGLMAPNPLATKMLEDTEKKFPELIPVAGLAQTATVRLLYRDTAIEEEDITETMALELTTKLEASKIGIRDDDFMAWHKSQFQEDVNPQLVLKELEELVAKAFHYDKRIFLSYRRSDTGLFVGRVSDRLTDGGFDVFYDQESLLLGENWKDRLKNEIAVSDVLLALIGGAWNPDRLYADDDVVRFEISQALQLGKAVIPLLVNRAAFPTKSELPRELHSMLDTQCAELEAGAIFDHQIESLLKSLEELTRVGQ